MNVGMFEDIKGRNNRIRVMGGVLLSQERWGWGGSKGKHGPKARCHLMGFHIYSYSVVPIADLHNFFFPLSAGAAKSGCIHPAS